MKWGTLVKTGENSGQVSPVASQQNLQLMGHIFKNIYIYEIWC